MAEQRVWQPIETGPATAHEAITRERVDRLSKELEEVRKELSGDLEGLKSELRARFNGLIWLVVGVVLVQVVLRVGGW